MNHNEIDEFKKIQPVIISAIATESGMSKDGLLKLNKKLSGWIGETKINDLTDVIRVCKGRYDTESFMVGVLISSVITRNTLDVHFKKISEQRNTNMLYSNAEMEFL
ncbi:MAG: hypothetical protein EF813_04670 [Methanosarcinales archaeon]|nr:MAG: hypothetical protein EF813_04670 [Methanosarcinales archaeon]